MKVWRLKEILESYPNEDHDVVIVDAGTGWYLNLDFAEPSRVVGCDVLTLGSDYANRWDGEADAKA